MVTVLACFPFKGRRFFSQEGKKGVLPEVLDEVSEEIEEGVSVSSFGPKVDSVSDGGGVEGRKKRG